MTKNTLPENPEACAIITRCPSCGNRHIKETDNYCTQCGHNLDVYNQTFKCCGARILIMHEDYFFCPYCGAPDPVNQVLSSSKGNPI